MDDRRDVHNQMVRETDEYGNPRPDTSFAERDADVTGSAASRGVTGGTDYAARGTPGATGIHVGEKGVMDKVKEKMPGMHATGTTTDTGYPHGEQQHQKKGMMEKIKEKMPGSHSQTTTGTGTTTTTDTGYAHGQEHGKKGTMEKIKEKLPGTGQHH